MASIRQLDRDRVGVHLEAEVVFSAEVFSGMRAPRPLRPETRVTAPETPAATLITRFCRTVSPQTNLSWLQRLHLQLSAQSSQTQIAVVRDFEFFRASKV